MASRISRALALRDLIPLSPPRKMKNPVVGFLERSLTRKTGLFRVTELSCTEQTGLSCQPRVEEGGYCIPATSLFIGGFCAQDMVGSGLEKNRIGTL